MTEIASHTEILTLPLQAADYLAWQIRRKLDQASDPNRAIKRLAVQSSEDRFVMQSGDVPIFYDVWDDQRLREVGRDVVNASISAMELHSDVFTAGQQERIRAIIHSKLRDFA